ncbi:hypothetical protein predicted by Glimmer/Critica [Salmonella enterica subsp. enterica serovar Weltevreden str. 2007-60-3289-1]|nr:hypothetical protein predicted by Glimmer/Critica [Salmonella enterica subsp. enterica serovar Weltevreden str. 2007-60-3289-1]
MLGNKKGLLEQIYSFSVFPAPAGINRGTKIFHFLSSGVPRASGDKPEAPLGLVAAGLCSPRQRG